MGLFDRPRATELAIPAAARGDDKAAEVLRVWIAGGDQHVSVRYAVWEEPAAWGLLLSDLAKHVARAYAQGEGLDYDAVLERIVAGLEAELSFSTDEGEGGLSDE